MNCGTSGRTPCTAIGNLCYQSVVEGNLLASRNFGGLYCMYCVGYPFFANLGHNLGAFYLDQIKFEQLRVMLLILLVVALNGTIILEQPANSLLEYYPRFRDMVMMLNNLGGPLTVPAPISQVTISIFPSQRFCAKTPWTW